MFSRKLRLIDIARQIDRDKSTIIRWEELGLIAQAKRDSRGWRYYSEQQADEIVRLVKETNYFRNDRNGSNGAVKNRIPKMVYIGVLAAIAFMIYQLFGQSYSVGAATSNEALYQTVSAGTLSILSASSSQSFDAAVTVSFSSQTSTLSDFSATRLQDARGSGAGWSLTFSCVDWAQENFGGAGERHNQLDCNSTGSDGNVGKLCLVANNGAIVSNAGQDTTNITKGTTDCFSAGTSSIDLYTAASGYGKGDYWIKDFDLQQYIPSSPTPQTLTTTLTLTLT